jgi:hypothetical protein
MNEIEKEKAESISLLALGLLEIVIHKAIKSIICNFQLNKNTIFEIVETSFN